jgi:MYXO-CTERM domain-containing protein
LKAIFRRFQEEDMKLARPQIVNRPLCLPIFVPALMTLAAIPSFASAISVTITPNAKYTDSIMPCSNPNGSWQKCGVNAFVSSGTATSISNFMNTSTFGGGQTLPNGGDIDFATAYDSWFLGNTGWNPLDNGTLNGTLTLNVDVFNAIACTGVGGLGQTCQPGPDTGIDVQLQNYVPGAGDPTVDQFFWVQGLLTNYQPGLPGNGSYNTSTVYNTLDTAAFNNIAGCQALPNPNNGTTPNVPAGTYCGPAYPYQLGPKNFSDAPKAPYPNGSFRGIALLATETSGPNGKSTLTVYGGVNYGFDVYAVAPEPGTWILGLAGLTAIVLLRRRNAREPHRSSCLIYSEFSISDAPRAR